MSNICLVATDAISFNVLYRGQLEHLKAQGHRLTLICGGEEEELRKLEARQVGEVVGVTLVRRPSLWADIHGLVELVLYLRRGHFDVVLVTTPKAILLGSIASWLTAQPRRVAFFRGRVYENFSGAKRWLYLFFDRVAASCSHEVLFVSRSLMAEYCGDSKTFTRKGRVLGAGSGNGVSAERFDLRAHKASKSHLLRKKLGLPDDAFVAVAIGRICSDKGLAELEMLARRAARDDHKVQFVLVGPVESGAELAFAQLMGQRNVVHVGFTPDITPYLALADVHIFLTHREGFGNVAVEAAAMGVPTVAFDVVGVRDSVAEGISGIRVPFGDVDAVWLALQEMRRDPKATSLHYAGARPWALENFAQERVWKLYGDFYEQG